MSTKDFSIPVLVKDGNFQWPNDESIFYLVTRDGLYLCRNHPFFKSSTPAAAGPGALLDQEPELYPNYPLIPRGLFEQVVGFFSRIGKLYGSEAAAFFVWDRKDKIVRTVVPEQEATVSRGWYGDVHPVGLHYQSPHDLPAHWVPFGDIHSHVKMDAYASGTDVHDEMHRPGLHLVVGHIDREPPSFHVEAVVDGTRFPMRIEDVIEGYAKRDEAVPQEWIDKVRVSDAYPLYRSNSKRSTSTYSSGRYETRVVPAPSAGSNDPGSVS